MNKDDRKAISEKISQLRKIHHQLDSILDDLEMIFDNESARLDNVSEEEQIGREFLEDQEILQDFWNGYDDLKEMVDKLPYTFFKLNSGCNKHRTRLQKNNWFEQQNRRMKK